MRMCRSTILTGLIAVSLWFACEGRASAQFFYPRSYYYPQNYSYYPQAYPSYPYSYPQSNQYSYWYEIPPYRTYDRRTADPDYDYTRYGVPPDYSPQRRATLYPAVPYPQDPDYYLKLTSNQWGNARTSSGPTYTFKVTVPTADAALLIGGVETTQKGIERSFVSPPLVASKQYTYTIEVIWSDKNGKRQDEQTRFTFSAGDPSTHLVFPLGGK